MAKKKEECPAAMVGRFIVTTSFDMSGRRIVFAVFLFDFVVASFFFFSFFSILTAQSFYMVHDACVTGACIFHLLHASWIRF